MTSTDIQPTTDAITAVGLKLPQFWAEEPQVWFVQAEAQFALRNITVDETKYFYVVSALDQHTARRVLDLLRSPPKQGKYKELKTRLLGTFDLSDFERGQALLDLPDLGDEKPSELMDKMLGLLGEHKPEFLFTGLFLRRMPEDIRGTLVHSGVSDHRQLAVDADKLWAARQIATSAVLRNKYQDRSTPRGSGLCFYHEKFGKKAYRCKQPCGYRVAAVSENELAGHH